MRQYKARAAKAAKAGHANLRHPAGLIMARDKILRVLGRDPTAGLAQAREWAKSDDPDAIQDAAVVFRDIGGHEGEARAADAAFRRAMAAQRARQGNG